MSKHLRHNSFVDHSPTEFQQCKDECSTMSPTLGNLDGVKIPARLLQQAKGVAVMTVAKGGFGVAGIEFGTGLVVASIFYSFPFMVQPLQSGFESINKNMIEASYISGKSQLTTLVRVVLPNIKPALLTAMVVTFAHTVGEFGVVLMVGGSIEGETKVASVAIYEMVEVMDYDSAHIYSAIMLLLSFLVLLSVYLFNHKNKKTI